MRPEIPYGAEDHLARAVPRTAAQYKAVIMHFRDAVTSDKAVIMHDGNAGPGARVRLAPWGRSYRA